MISHRTLIGYTKKSSDHLLGVDLKMPIDPSNDLPSIISGIHAQGGLAIASHPHVMESEWGKNTLYLWENQERFAPLFDAWEIANRNNIFNRVGLKKLPFVANSDFHKPKHVYSWKTLLLCEKESEAIKQCTSETTETWQLRSFVRLPAPRHCRIAWPANLTASSGHRLNYSSSCQVVASAAYLSRHSPFPSS